jgi:hypothetical protein
LQNWNFFIAFKKVIINLIIISDFKKAIYLFDYLKIIFF